MKNTRQRLISFAYLSDQAQEMSSVVLLHSPPMRSNFPLRRKSSSPGDMIKLNSLLTMMMATMATTYKAL